MSDARSIRSMVLVAAGAAFALLSVYGVMVVYHRSRMCPAPADGRSFDAGTVYIVPNRSGCWKVFAPVLMPGFWADSAITGRRYVLSTDPCPIGGRCGEYLW